MPKASSIIAGQSTPKASDMMAGGKKSKNGCFPKLFILALPFMAVGAYFFLGS